MTETLPGDDADGSESLAARLEALRGNGADRFDPVRFRFIECLARRARAQRPAVAQRLEQRALNVLQRYVQVHAGVREKTVATTSSPALQRPQSGGTVQSLLECLAPADGEGRADPDGADLEQILRQQEEQMVRLLLESGPAASTLSVQSLPTARTELRAMRRCREAQVQRGAAGLVTRAIGECPENAGPLNSQRLAMRSLSIMQQLSPRYLQRFVAHMDTLYWLEQSAPNRPATASAGKASTARAGARKGRRKPPQP